MSGHPVLAVKKQQLPPHCIPVAPFSSKNTSFSDCIQSVMTQQGRNAARHSLMWKALEVIGGQNTFFKVTTIKWGESSLCGNTRLKLESVLPDRRRRLNVTSQTAFVWRDGAVGSEWLCAHTNPVIVCCYQGCKTVIYVYINISAGLIVWFPGSDSQAAKTWKAFIIFWWWETNHSVCLCLCRCKCTCREAYFFQTSIT